MDDDRARAKKQVVRTLRSPNSTGQQITEALTTYFKKYTFKDVKILAAEKIEPVTVDILSIFDGSVTP